MPMTGPLFLGSTGRVARPVWLFRCTLCGATSSTILPEDDGGGRCIECNGSSAPNAWERVRRRRLVAACCSCGRNVELTRSTLAAGYLHMCECGNVAAIRYGRR